MKNESLFMNYYILLLCVPFLMASCKDNSATQETTLSINFTQEKSISPSEIVDISFIKLETKDDCLIKGIKQIEMNDEQLFILTGGSFDRI